MSPSMNLAPTILVPQASHLALLSPFHSLLFLICLFRCLPSHCLFLHHLRFFIIPILCPPLTAPSPLVAPPLLVGPPCEITRCYTRRPRPAPPPNSSSSFLGSPKRHFRLHLCLRLLLPQRLLYLVRSPLLHTTSASCSARLLSVPPWVSPSAFSSAYSS